MKCHLCARDGAKHSITLSDEEAEFFGWEKGTTFYYCDVRWNLLHNKEQAENLLRGYTKRLYQEITQETE